MGKTERKLWLIVTAVVAASVGVAMTVATLYFLSSTPTGDKLRQRLGLKDLGGLTLETTRTQKIVVEESSAIIEAAKRVNPAVVSITSLTSATRTIPGLGTIRAPRTSGTGFVVTTDGLIATNKHVVSEADSYNVTTIDGKDYQGKVVARDPLNDLALLKVEAKGLAVADLGNSEDVQVGQWVIAIGNALGELHNSVTVGVVSAKERTAAPEGGAELYGLLQTDAAINFGNSGGPLLSLAGKVVGINTAIGSGENIGFAIPVNDLKKALESYRAHGKIIRPYMGVRYQPITKALATTLKLPVEGGALLVSLPNSPAVTPHSPAAAAGLKENDIITRLNDKQVDEKNPLAKLLREYKPGDQITLTVVRDGKTIFISLTLGSLPGD